MNETEGFEELEWRIKEQRDLCEKLIRQHYEAREELLRLMKRLYEMDPSTWFRKTNQRKSASPPLPEKGER